ncbi:MAG: hypothetical protein MZV70_29725 [Desulfobacterales bacterium]|nr:hypothetical protein [Desulfobacterales bacterium]
MDQPRRRRRPRACCPADLINRFRSRWRCRRGERRPRKASTGPDRHLGDAHGRHHRRCAQPASAFRGIAHPRRASKFFVGAVSSHDTIAVAAADLVIVRSASAFFRPSPPTPAPSNRCHRRRRPQS